MGPILFTFYINDIMNVQLLAGTMSLYADDIMFYCIIRSATDYHALPIDIDSLCCWTDRNLLTFNANKCKYMVISRKKRQTLPTSPITIKDASLECVSSYKYLGVWLTSTFKLVIAGHRGVQESKTTVRHAVAIDNSMASLTPTLSAAVFS